jgi:nephrocystin-4
LIVKRKVSGDLNAVVNIVDIETRSLLASYYIVTHQKLPDITKVFEIKLTKGKGSNKRVSYTNPFNHSNTLYLSTDRPDLLEFKAAVLELHPRETVFLGLKFNPCFLSNAEIFIFLNNEKDKIEECLLINTLYV